MCVCELMCLFQPHIINFIHTIAVLCKLTIEEQCNIVFITVNYLQNMFIYKALKQIFSKLKILLLHKSIFAVLQCNDAMQYLFIDICFLCACAPHTPPETST